MLPQRRQMLARGNHGHAVAEFEHQIRIGEQRRIPATHFHDVRVHAIGERHDSRIGTPVSAGARHEEPRDVERAAIARQETRPPRGPAAGARSSIAPGSPNSSSTSPASSRIDGSGSLLVCPCRTATSRTPAGRPAITSATVAPCRSAPSITSTPVGGAGAGTRRAWITRENTKMQRIGPITPIGIGHGIPNRGRLIADRVDRGLQRRRAGERPGKHAQGVRRRDVERDGRPRPPPPASTTRRRRPAHSTSGHRRAGRQKIAGRTGCRCRRET